MKIFIYADESGVFDVKHYDYYVFAWVLCLGKETEDAARKYLAIEKILREKTYYSGLDELKAFNLRPKHKMQLYKSLNSFHRGSVVIDQNLVDKNIFAVKKTKQRFLDYAFKRGIKEHLMELVASGALRDVDVKHLRFALDEHTTATNGKYELKESLIEELKNGTFNYNYQHFFKPPFPGIESLNLKYYDSRSKTLIRAADIIANVTLHNATKGSLDKLEDRQFIMRLP
jgi:hypothetical protein|nr:MAG TPA: hypothetical protein [Caudoviricetes sp.]DAW29289.1 MAG TPA: hypothetical protein [Caudoviricetes sp.]